MNPPLRELGVDALGLVVSRCDVELLNVKPTLSTLRSVLADAPTVRLFQGKVDISFEGWDDDPREIYKIPEIRTFLHLLDEEFPYWFYFLSTKFETLRMVAFCLCHASRAGVGMAQVEPSALQAFLVTHFNSMNQLFGRYGLDERINEEISQCLLGYFTGRMA